jgi:acyl carrier protein
MTSSELYLRLTPIFHDIFDDESLVLSPNMTASDVDEWDSLSHIRLVLAIEKTFGLKFNASEVAKLQNVGEFVDLIQSKQS